MLNQCVTYSVGKHLDSPFLILFPNIIFPNDHFIFVSQDKQGRESYVITCCFGLNEKKQQNYVVESSKTS